jgi:hypothetical protein
MAAPNSRLTLKSREDFAALSLHEKNAYLQNVARQVVEAAGESFEPLDKDSLSRIRRFYSRRGMADLGLENVPDTALKASLERFAHAIRSEEIRKVINHELPSHLEPNELHSVIRAPPINDAQMMFFVAVVSGMRKRIEQEGRLMRATNRPRLDTVRARLSCNRRLLLEAMPGTPRAWPS